MKVYAITYRKYMSTSGPGVDWQLTPEKVWNVMADNALLAVDALKAIAPDGERLEIQAIQSICTVDLVAKK